MSFETKKQNFPYIFVSDQRMIMFQRESFSCYRREGIQFHIDLHYISIAMYLFTNNTCLNRKFVNLVYQHRIPNKHIFRMFKQSGIEYEIWFTDQSLEACSYFILSSRQTAICTNYFPGNYVVVLANERQHDGWSNLKLSPCLHHRFWFSTFNFTIIIVVISQQIYIC